MAVKAIICIVSVLAVALIGVSAYPAGEKLGRDDFVSSSIASVFDKVGQYTSGEKKIIEREGDSTVRSTGYNTDGLGRTTSEPNITIRGNIPSDKKPSAETKTP